VTAPCTHLTHHTSERFSDTICIFSHPISSPHHLLSTCFLPLWSVCDCSLHSPHSTICPSGFLRYVRLFFPIDVCFFSFGSLPASDATLFLGRAFCSLTRMHCYAPGGQNPHPVDPFSSLFLVECDCVCTRLTRPHVPAVFCARFDRFGLSTSISFLWSPAPAPSFLPSPSISHYKSFMSQSWSFLIAPSAPRRACAAPRLVRRVH